MRYGSAVLVVALAALAAGAVFGRSNREDVIMVYLLGIVIVALRFGQGPSLVAGMLSVLTFDFFFVPPYLTFAVHDVRHVVTFAVMMFVAVVISSLTERAREADMRRAEIEGERLKTTLLSSVSHDLRTPLAVMTGAASALLDPASESLSPEDRRHLLSTIYEEGERLGRLIRNLLDISRLESGAVHIKKEWCPIEEIVSSALSRLETRLGDREVRVDVGDDLVAPVDVVLIEQLFVNVLENAAKYAGEDSPIEIAGRRVGDRMFVEIADRGPGFAPGDEKRVFDKFYRGSHQSAPGAGLGLAIAKAIATVHEATLSVANRPGGGATVVLALPIEGAPPPSPLGEVP